MCSHAFANSCTSWLVVFAQPRPWHMLHCSYNQLARELDCLTPWFDITVLFCRLFSNMSANVAGYVQDFAAALFDHLAQAPLVANQVFGPTPSGS